jgi:hypothetical protein
VLTLKGSRKGLQRLTLGPLEIGLGGHDRDLSHVSRAGICAAAGQFSRPRGVTAGSSWPVQYYTHSKHKYISLREVIA